MFDDFILRAALGGIGLALVAGPLGCFVVWQRMSYFGATIAHAALLGVALGFFSEVEPIFGILIVSVIFGVGIVGFQGKSQLASDTVLGIFAHVALALGVLVIGLMETPNVNITGYLFGDILAVRARDILGIYIGGSASLGVLLWIWRPLLAITVHEELAMAEGISLNRTRLIYTVLLATVIALAIKIVGVLLIVSMLIIPAAGARYLSRTPERMAFNAAGIGCISVTVGLGASFKWDMAAGPSIVIAAFLLFAVTWIIGVSNRKRLHTGG